MAQLSKKTVQHFTHCHPLTEVLTNTEFFCDGCRTLGSGKLYRCEPCNFNLHDHCANCPMELSSFMHEHGLKLVVPQATRQNDRVCDLCGDPVEGLFYGCKICEFGVHPLCTQLPEYVRHVMHMDHPLRLQRSVPARCMVCKDQCTSLRYRCGSCSFDLHPECVLAPCEEAATMSTPRSLETPAPPPSASPPSFDAYGYGAIPPHFAYAYRVPFAPPYSVPHAHDYGIPSSSGQYNVYSHHTPYTYRAPFAPPYSVPHAHGYGIPSSSGQYNVYSHHTPYAHGYGIPSSSGQYNVYSHHTPYAYRVPFAPPYSVPHAHGYGIPSSSGQYNVYSHHTPYTYRAPFAPPYSVPNAHGHGIPSSSGEYNVNSNHTHSNSSQVQGNGGKVRKKMYAIVGNLALGVLSNIVFGALFA